MKLRWKIALGIAGSLAAIAAGGVTWLLVVPPDPAVIAEPGPTGRRIDAGGIFANYYPAPGEGPHPAVLVLGGSEGGLGKGGRARALKLQEAGFAVLQLAYHNAPGKPDRLVNVPLEDFYNGLDWLKRQPGIDSNRIAIMGASKGAEAGLLVATRYPGIRAAVLGMPSSVVWDGLSNANFMFGSFSSSWSEKGEPIPHLAHGRAGPEMITLFENGLKELDRNPAAIIPVELFKGRLMLVCGEAEKLWPSCPMTDQIVARARMAGGPSPIVLRYKDAGHDVMGVPSGNLGKAGQPAEFGGTVESNIAARADSWPKIVEFLRTELTAAP
jgi:dienelactone hydrolase